VSYQRPIGVEKGKEHHMFLRVKNSWREGVGTLVLVGVQGRKREGVYVTAGDRLEFHKGKPSNSKPETPLSPGSRKKKRYFQWKELCQVKKSGP